MINTQVITVKNWPTFQQISKLAPQSQIVVLLDEALLKNSTLKKSLNSWLKSFEFVVSVEAGEDLKTLECYHELLETLQEWQEKGALNTRPHFVALGGGSVGDFVGFVASTYQRGCALTHIPSTWLAAIDSSHGGKTGLNLNQVKNQVGTFYPAGQVFISHQILKSQPEDRLTEAYGELIKMCLIGAPELFEKFEISEKFVLKNLDTLIDEKMNVVLQDPHERSGLRQILNLGHTLGHVYEAELKLSHGRAVLMGLIFSLRWSYHKGLMGADHFFDLLSLIMSLPNSESDLMLVNKLAVERVTKALSQDKKMTKASRKGEKQMKFVFCLEPGLVKVETVKIEAIIQEFARQKLKSNLF